MVAKYIIFETDTFCRITCHAVVFSETIKHSTMKNPLLGVAVNAGFCQIFNDGTVEVWGSSSALNLVSEPNDAVIIKNQITVGK